MLTEVFETILSSDSFKKELEDLSTYAANLKQEKPIALLLAKYLNSYRYPVVLDNKKGGRFCDLLLGNKAVEVKYNLDLGVVHQIDPDSELFDIQADKKSKSDTIPGIIKDVLIKRCDGFIWVVHSRDLRKLAEDDMFKAVHADLQKEYNKTAEYTSAKHYDNAVGFIGKLRKERDCLVTEKRIDTKGLFPSTYYFFILDFTK